MYFTTRELVVEVSSLVVVSNFYNSQKIESGAKAKVR